MAHHHGQAHESPGETGGADLEPAPGPVKDPDSDRRQGEGDDPAYGKRNHRRVGRLLLGHVKMLAMPFLASLARVVAQVLQRFVYGLRWLAVQAYRQRTLGVSSNPQLTRLLDVHFVTVAAHLALLVALIVASPSPTGRDWLLSLPLLALLTGVAIWRPTRLVIAVLLAAQLTFYLIAGVWARPGIVLTVLFALAVAQQAAVTRAAGGKLGRATAAGLLLGIFTAGTGLIFGLIAPAVPLWICTLLMVVAVVLSLRMPPRPPRAKLPKQQPRQTPQRPAAPEGYTVYRPSSLDDK
jgi:hypothetical protein